MNLYRYDSSSSRMCALAILALAWILATSAASAAQATSVDELWKDFDPQALPLDIQLLDQWEQDGIILRKVFFTSELYQGVPVRVYAIYGVPVGKTHLPAVLHIHGGGQTVSLDNVLFWAKRGYAAATFDHMGPMYDRTIYTHWGKVPIEQQFDGIKENPKNDRFYHSTIAARRALTFLASQPEVDPNHMGIYGISFGGSFTWLVSALDSRVRCAVPIYGCGGLGEKMGSAKDWAALYDAFTYAPRQRCPVLLLNASNDHHGYIDHADHVMRLTNTDKRVAYTHGYIHHIEPTEAADLPLWMDTYLRGGPVWPKTPTLSVVLGADRVPKADITLDNTQLVTNVYVRYNIENGAESPARFWRTAEATMLADGKWSAPMPVMDPGKTIRAYCDVRYRSGIALSSLLTNLVPSSLGSIRATLKPSRVIDDFVGGRICDWYNDATYTDPILLAGDALTPLVDGADGKWAIIGNTKVLGTVSRICTTKIGDPAFFGGTRKGIAFMVRATAPSKLTLVLTRDLWKSTATEYRCELKLPENGKWAKIQVRQADLKDKDGKSLDNWNNVQQLRFESEFPGGKPIAFANVEWTD